MNEPKKRVRTITVRHQTPSRSAITIVVSQYQDALGNWLAPTILWNGPMSAILESGRYARDVGLGLIVAAYYYDLMMLAVESAQDVLDREDRDAQG